MIMAARRFDVLDWIQWFFKIIFMLMVVAGIKRLILDYYNGEPLKYDWAIFFGGIILLISTEIISKHIGI